MGTNQFHSIYKNTWCGVISQSEMTRVARSNRLDVRFVSRMGGADIRVLIPPVFTVDKGDI